MTDNMQARIHAAGYADHTHEPERRRTPPWWAAAIPVVLPLFLIAAALVAWGLR